MRTPGSYRIGWLCLVMAGGCVSVPPYAGPLRLPTEAAAPVQDPVVGPLSLEQAVRRALQHSSELAMLRGEAETAIGEIESAGDIRDPEVRLGYSEMDARSTRTGWRTQTSTESDRGSSTRTETVTDPFEPERYTESSFGSTVRSRSSSLSGGDGIAWQESWDIGLRLFPPNPWTYASQKSLAAAEAYVAQAELCQAQVDVAAEVAVLFSEVQHLQGDVKLLEQLAALHKSTYDAYHELHERSEGMTTLGEDLLIWRRYQGTITDLGKAQRDLDTARRELAGYVAVPFSDLDVATHQDALADWELADLNDELLREQALNGRADVAGAGWRVIAAEAALREALSLRIPWLSHVEAAYGIASGGNSANRWSEEQTSTTESGRSDSTETGISTSTSTETETSRGSTSSREGVYENETRDEWFVGFGVNIPIFSWTKSGVKARTVEHRHALEVLDKVRREAARRVTDGIEALRKAEAARREHAEQAAAAKAYLDKGLAKTEAQGALSASQILPFKAGLLELERAALNLDRAYRLAAIELHAAQGHIVGVTRPSASVSPSEGWPTVTPVRPPAAGVPHGALHAAVRLNDVRRVAALLAVSSPDAVNATRNHAVTPLHLAAAMNHKEVAELLIARGANIKAVTSGGYTPLHWAASRNAADTAQLLIARGSDVNARARDGTTPLRWATSKSAMAVVRLLEAAGAETADRPTISD